LLACQPVLLQEQLDHGLALLFDLFLFLAHISCCLVNLRRQRYTFLPKQTAIARKK
jgi:hypothetical protein